VAVVVVGAGLAGLAAAEALTRAGVPVTVVDAASRPGGALARQDELAVTRGERTLALPMRTSLGAIPDGAAQLRALLDRLGLTRSLRPVTVGVAVQGESEALELQPDRPVRSGLRLLRRSGVVQAARAVRALARDDLLPEADPEAWLAARGAGRPAAVLEGDAGPLLAALVRRIEAQGGEVHTGSRCVSIRLAPTGVRGVVVERAGGVREHGGDDVLVAVTGPGLSQLASGAMAHVLEPALDPMAVGARAWLVYGGRAPIAEVGAWRGGGFDHWKRLEGWLPPARAVAELVGGTVLELRLDAGSAAQMQQAPDPVRHLDLAVGRAFPQLDGHLVAGGWRYEPTFGLGDVGVAGLHALQFDGEQPGAERAVVAGQEAARRIALRRGIGADHLPPRLPVSEAAWAGLATRLLRP
jgi:hypothetical protein